MLESRPVDLLEGSGIKRIFDRRDVPLEESGT